MDELSKAQEGAEALAHILASFYMALIRDGVPKAFAQTLTYNYQEKLLNQKPPAEE